MLSLIHRARQRTSSKKKPDQQCPFNALCAWMANDVEHVQQASIKLLLATFGAGGFSWVSKQALRNSSLELLDYCLKHLGGKLESSSVQNVDGSELDLNFPSEEQILCDLKFLYDSILHPDTMLSYTPQSMKGNELLKLQLSFLIASNS
ncbi:hypothetical protein DVH24_009550 [Malus domestica]|uniref:Uncharacterized protein n=1 Tax=Malus domestica TaxID=3750 RepID=A0A498IR88_MALDO|nr:hypothetical protein DVH24_009550 [Malus domestica]